MRGSVSPHSLGKKMYRLENNLEVFKNNSEGEFHFVKRGVGIQDTIHCDNKGVSFLEAIKNNNGYISEELAKENMEYISFLESRNFITKKEYPNNNHPFRTQLQALEEWGLNPEFSQVLIENAKVAIIGCGGTGGWLAIELASLGVGNIKLIDNDIVEESNLMRQPFNYNQIGTYKTHALKENIKSKNSKTVVETEEIYIDEEVKFSGIFNGYDYICIAADHPSRDSMGLIVGKWCLQNKVNHFICGGYSGHNTSLGLSVIPGKTYCWECYLYWYKDQISKSILNEPFMKGPRNPSGVFPIVMLAASMNALDILRTIVNVKPVLVNSRIDMHPSELNFNKKDFEKNPSCSYCKEIK